MQILIRIYLSDVTCHWLILTHLISAVCRHHSFFFAVLSASLQLLSIQLLDLMHTLHTRAASIFSSWAEEEQKGTGDKSPMTVDGGKNVNGSADLPRVDSEGLIFSSEAATLWGKCWCPLLQGKQLIPVMVLGLF